MHHFGLRPIAQSADAQREVLMPLPSLKLGAGASGRALNTGLLVGLCPSCEILQGSPPL